MNTLSGNLEAGKILLLIGAILGALGAVVILIVAVGMVAMASFLSGDSGGFGIIGIVYLLMALLSGAGAIVGFLAYGRARAGDARGAWVRGLVASLLPPVQVVLLIGAVLCKVSPECKSQEAGGAAYQPPGVSWNAPR